MLNDDIHDKEVRVIDQNGEQLGIMSIAAAMKLAEEKDLDLAKIVPQAKPPVCKIMDYGKYRFELIKREKEARKNQKVIEIKEVRLSATIDQHDLEVKAKAAQRFITDGDKVKVAIRFRGRQASHSEIGLAVMKTFYEMLKDICAVEKQPKLEGRNMTMFLTGKNN
jgi:translation initiation factor IF-3